MLLLAALRGSVDASSSEDDNDDNDNVNASQEQTFDDDKANQISQFLDLIGR